GQETLRLRSPCCKEIWIMAGAGAAVVAGCSAAESCTGTMVGDVWCTMDSDEKGVHLRERAARLQGGPAGRI
ncbi:hypothetical protein BUE93_21570, partial [Chromobacterium amazonense]